MAQLFCIWTGLVALIFIFANPVHAQSNNSRNQIDFYYLGLKQTEAKDDKAARALRNWANILQQELVSAVVSELSSEIGTPDGVYLSEIKFHAEYDRDTMTFSDIAEKFNKSSIFQIIENIAFSDGEKLFWKGRIIVKGEEKSEKTQMPAIYRIEDEMDRRALNRALGTIKLIAIHALISDAIDAKRTPRIVCGLAAIGVNFLRDLSDKGSGKLGRPNPELNDSERTVFSGLFSQIVDSTAIRRLECPDARRL